MSAKCSPYMYGAPYIFHFVHPLVKMAKMMVQRVNFERNLKKIRPATVMPLATSLVESGERDLGNMYVSVRYEEISFPLITKCLHFSLKLICVVIFDQTH